MTPLLPKQAIEESSKFLIDSYSPYDSYAIVLHTASAAELPFYFIKAINNSCDQNPYTDFHLFVINKGNPVLTPYCGSFNVNELSSYNGVVIATDLISWQSSVITPTKNKFLYLYDIGRLAKITPDLVKAINQSEFKIFSRSKEHNKLLQKLGINIINEYCDYPDNPKLLEIVNKYVIHE